MAILIYTLMGFSALSFIFFGYACLTSPFMVQEFERYKLGKYRELNGYLQLLGALALLAGYFYTPLALMGSLGLGVLMLLGFSVRLRLRDSLLKSLPAFFYMLLNVTLFILLLFHSNV